MHDIENLEISDEVDPPPRLYSLPWAEKVYENLNTSYPQSIRIIYDIYPTLNRDIVIGFLRDKAHQGRWESFKVLIKYLEHNYPTLARYFGDDYEKILLHLRRLVSKEFLMKAVTFHRVED